MENIYASVVCLEAGIPLNITGPCVGAQGICVRGL